MALIRKSQMSKKKKITKTKKMQEETPQSSELLFFDTFSHEVNEVIT